MATNTQTQEPPASSSSSTDDAPTSTSTTPTPTPIFTTTRNQSVNITVPYSPITSFTFDGNPLDTIALEEAEPAADKTHLLPGTCHLRRKYGSEKNLEARRASILALAHSTIHNPDRLPSIPLPKQAEVLIKDLLIKLDELLIGMPYIKANTNELGYFLNPTKFKDFDKTIHGYARRARPLINGTLIVPIWGMDNDPLNIWPASDFELLSVLYRDEIESLLAHLYHSDALISSKDTPSRPSTPGQWESEGIMHSTPKMREPTEEKIPIEQTQESVYHSAVRSTPPLQTRKPRNPRISEERGFEEARRHQAERNYEPRSRPSTYGILPDQITDSRRISELFEEPRFYTRTFAPPVMTGAGAPGDPDGSSDSDQDDGPARPPPARPRAFGSQPFGHHPPPPPPPRGRRGPGGNRGDGGGPPSDPPDDYGDGDGYGYPRRNPLPYALNSIASRDKELHFDLKLKPEVVPKWDGDPDTLSKWILKINNLAEQSSKIYQQLGGIVPRRLEKDADSWFWSLPSFHRRNITSDWGTLRKAICSYYMNRAWLDRQKSRANKAHYREPGHSSETPTSYFIRKSELLSLVYSYSDSEIMMEVMEGAPKYWTTILDPHRCKDLIEFASAIKYHEEALISPPFSADNSVDRRLRSIEQMLRDQSSRPFRNTSGSSSSFNRFRARTNLIGFTPSLGKPQFPKDDATISKGVTPEKKGVRPCRHCGSGKHWDNDCKYAKRGAKNVRANFVNPSAEYLEAMDEYEEAYFNASDEESDDNSQEVTSREKDFESSSHEDPQQDFHEALQVQAVSDSSPFPSATSMKIQSSLRGSEKTGKQQISEKRRNKRKLLNGIFKATNFVGNAFKTVTKEILSLPRLMARPPGCSFLGAQATATTAWLGSYGLNETRVVIDSGADITLVSQSFLAKMQNPPKIKGGQRVNLIQVTGTSSISGFVTLPIYFETDSGPIEITVEAYVVKGMTTPFILGNDFADQFGISIIRDENGVKLTFGNSGCSIQVQNSIGSTMTDSDGQAFSVAKAGKSLPKTSSEIVDQEISLRKTDTTVRASISLIIPPQSVSSLPVQLNFPKNLEYAYVEKIFISNRGEEDFYAIPDSLIQKKDPKLFVSNFSSFPVHIHEGQIVGYAHNPNTWLDTSEKMSEEKYSDLCVHAFLVRSLIDSLSKRTSTIESEGQDEASGGPKTAEVPPMDVSSNKLFEEIDFSNGLSPEQLEKLKKVLWENKDAFGLDGRLGHHPTKVEIPLRSGFKEISLPPFFASPKSREVIDEQMDKWLKLEVIEPSKSPWGAPAFIVYRQEKPRMVIDFRKLNEQVIPDEFPLPRQDDILKSLTGSQWLSTLDALAGFTQLEIAEKDREKTAFRTHRGLYQFLRMPFGYRNGPAVFQRVMQNVLAPYLWIFTLVYIDDIVIYSKNFDDHLTHIDLVLKSVIDAKITLSPSKCHFCYQSLRLLGQKVSRLGLSTYKEKVDAILHLSEPRNVHELQTFLGMMVYFAAYIPYYAWIVNPLFTLLKKKITWIWGEAQQNAFNLAKQALTSAPVRAYPIPSLGYRLYSDACDIGVAAILQQIQPILIRDLRGTKAYKKLELAHQKGEPIPSLIVPISKEENLPKSGEWNESFEQTTVHVERVIAYWSRTLKSAERNYSPTEREALALKDGLVKFQPYIEGEKIFAITDHAALTWTRTFQNINRRLLTWGTIFAAYPELKIVHRAGRVHSNVDPISRLRRRYPSEDGPSSDTIESVTLHVDEDPMTNFYDELGENFEQKVLNVVSSVLNEETIESVDPLETSTRIYTSNLGELDLPITTSSAYSVFIGLDPSEIKRFEDGYKKDLHFSKVLNSMRTEENLDNPMYPQYRLGDNNLLYFEDSIGSTRLCVPESIRNELMSDAHNELFEGAHAGYHKTYNRISSGYYWPRMSREILRYVRSCDICQKSKPKRHAPFGMLQPIPIPSQPFEVITMDFITDLPESDGFNNILVVVDKLTKYVIINPCRTEINEEETAQLLFESVFKQFGLPRQIISDRDARWTGKFWESVCRQLGIKRGLTTAYHPQADGQSEIMNQTLEVCLRAYVGPDRNDWVKILSGFALAYNTSTHSVTGFTPSFLLYGFHPNTKLSFTSPQKEVVPRPGSSVEGTVNVYPRSEKETDTGLTDDSHLQGWSKQADIMIDEFRANRMQAKDELTLGQVFQKKYYNKGRLNIEFNEGDLVLINPHSLGLLRRVKGKGNKLLMQYDGPFEILNKISRVAYRLRMPASYGMHPVLNIAHLEPYESSPASFGTRPTRSLGRNDFEELVEYEVEAIIDEKWSKTRAGKRQKLYLTRFKSYSPEYDEWLTRRQLKNAPDVLRSWETRRRVSQSNIH